MNKNIKNLNMSETDCKLSTNQNFGYSSRLQYDESAYQDRLNESVGPLYYKLNPDMIHNCGACFTSLGPRSSYNGYGVSMPVDNQPAVAQTPELVNIESILTNRNVPTSKNKKNQVNPIDVTKFQVKHPRVCGKALEPLSTKLSHPSMLYKDTGVNRFYNLNKPVQQNIFYDFAENTRLSAKDGYEFEVPKLWSVHTTIPHPKKDQKTCKTIKMCSINSNKFNE